MNPGMKLPRHIIEAQKAEYDAEDQQKEQQQMMEQQKMQQDQMYQQALLQGLADVAMMLQNLQATIAAPKVVVRGPDGMATGVVTQQAGNA